MNSQSADIEAKKAKKRAWDRVAQRTLRQKTKSHIEYLEQTVRALQSQTSEDFVVNLIQEKEHLLAENEHLRKIITDARIMLSVYHPSSSPPSKAEARRSLLAIHRVCSSSNYNSQEHRYESSDFWRSKGFKNSPLSICSTAQTARTSSQHQSSVTYSSCCSVWCCVNDILDEVSHSDAETLAPDVEEFGFIVQGIFNGGGSLDPLHKPTSSLRILRCMDQYIWCTIPKVQRLAIAFKSYQLIKYILKPGPETREKIPWWELLTSLQLSQQHPVAIDFFPWPEVRDRLIINHAYYLGKCDFFSCTQEYLFSNWPYGIRDCFVLDDQSTYRPSQAFIQHVNSLTNWSMCPAFFERYPEFIGIIPPASAAWEGTETWRA